MILLMVVQGGEACLPMPPSWPEVLPMMLTAHLLWASLLIPDASHPSSLVQSSSRSYKTKLIIFSLAQNFGAFQTPLE